MIVGLGNPGYDGTRHNVGFMVIDEIRRELHAGSWTRAPGFDYLRTREAAVTILLVKPLTYMNLSGTAVRDALTMSGIPLERTLIVLDDFQIPLGALRMRPAGSDGGHRGLASVITTLETEAVPRLRCGIGGEALPPKDGRRDFVLENFSAGEDAPARTMIGRAAEAARMFALSGIGRAMTVYNTQ